MKKLYCFIFAFLLVFQIIPCFSQGYTLKSEISPVPDTVDSRFNVTATVMDNDTWCSLLWPGIYNYDELAFDDGEADDFFIFSTPGGINANKFTPLWYPAEVTGGNIYVGNGLFPGPFLGTQFRAMIFDDDGPNGLPGTVLDSLDITVENYYWVEFEGMSAIINSGNFYLGMKQLASSPDAAPIGVDTDNPTYYKSYSYLNGFGWVTSPLQDFMIRAWVSNGNINEDVDFYQVDRFSNFDPNGSPLLGDTTFLDTRTNPYYNDHEWAPLPMGWYAYGVKEHYISGGWSDYNLSNLAGHLTSYTITINITICDTTWWEYMVIKINGEEVPAELTPGGATVTLEFNSPFPGHIDIWVYSPGNDPYILNNVVISPDKVINIYLSCTRYPVRNLFADPVSLIVTWDRPQVVTLEQYFKDGIFPPPGWQMQSQGSGWFRTEDGTGGGWVIPGWNSHYACTNDLLTGGNDGSQDFLISPAVRLDYRPDYILSFDSYFDGFNNQDAYIEYSFDGEDWDILYELDPSTEWESLELSLSPFSGPEIPPIWFAFHADDNGQDGSGWAVDNVRIYSPEPPYTLDGYWVYIDDSLFAVTDTNFIDISPLTYGESYTISVKAHYPSGLSTPVSDTVFCEYLYPPSCFYQENDLLLIACPPLDTNGNIPSNLLGLNLFRNMEFIGYYSFVPEPPPFPVEISISEGPPGIYNYGLTAVYDLTPYGYPGELGESGSLTTEVVISYGYPLPFLEQWNLGTFETNNWIADGPNWSITGQEGNPAPSAEFTWDPIQTDYSISLESYPFQADSMTEGQIYLDFDIRLSSFQATGTELLLVQVWNWESQSWTTVSTYSNEESSFGWMSEHLNITDQTTGTIFKVRFTAQGEYSVNILSWFVDNIHIYRACLPPLELTVEVNWQLEGFELNWEPPEVSWIDEWIHWDDGVNSGNSIGTGEAAEFDVAARWEPAQLAMYEGASVTEIGFFPAEAASIYKVRVWVGAGAANLVVDQPVGAPIIGQWNYVTLTTPIPIDVTQELWVGYYVNTTTGFPAGVDDGPANDSYGNMMNFGGWQTLLEINPELDFNWNISAHIETVDKKKPKSEDSILKYAVYRNDDGTGYFLLDYTYEETYFDNEPCGYGNVYCYQVTAQYFSNIDSCESEPSNESCFLCWFNIDEPSAFDLKIYPNPVSDFLFIEAIEKIESIIIFDSRGITQERWNAGTLEHLNNGTVAIPVNELVPGLYLVRVETGGQAISRKVMIVH